MLRNLIATDDRASSHSDNSSPEDVEREEVKGPVKEENLRKRRSDEARPD